MNKKILVLGGTGHLGSALIHHLHNDLHIPAANIRVFYLPNTPTNSLGDISGIDFYPGNILEISDVKAATEGMDLVFHMVGNTTFDPTKKKIQWRINVEGTRNVLETYRSSPWIEKMCYTSTVNVLGVPNPVGGIGNFETSNPYTNNPRIHAFNSPEEILKFTDQIKNHEISNWEKKVGVGYHNSKLAAQELVNYYVRTYGLNIVSILPGTMFGPYDYLIGNGMYLLSIYHNKIPGALVGGLPCAHVSDVAEGHVIAMQKAKKGSRYILTGRREDNLYLKDIFKIIAEVAHEKFPEKKIKIPEKVISTKLALFGGKALEALSKITRKSPLLSYDSVISGIYPSFYTYADAERDLGYVPKRTFREGVSEMYDYFIAQGLLNVKERFVDK